MNRLPAEHSLVVAVIGQPNAGKSSLVNLIVGEKVSIVTHKVQTTRFNIKGIYNEGDTQLVFIDTPGIFDPQKTLEKVIVRNAINSIDEADLVCLLIDAKRFSSAGIDPNILNNIKSIKKPLYAALNKLDTLPSKQSALPLINQLKDTKLFKEIFVFSVLKNQSVDRFVKFLLGQAEDREWIYRDDEITDQSLQDVCREITREQAFILLHEEIPYSLKVEIDRWEETEKYVKIYQSIFVTKDSQKNIILGRKGSKIKEIGTRARSEMRRFIDKEIHLFLFVKVREDWIDRDHA
jgi:GTPase